MKSVNIAELKNKLSAYLNEVRAGRELVIRDRNTPIARLIPIDPDSLDDDEELAALAAAGIVRIGGGEIDNDFWKLPAPRVDNAEISRVIDADRDDR
jgi:prevent-host-death family protein